MMRPPTVTIPILGWMLGILVTKSALAAEHDCTALNVQADAVVLGRWPDLVRQIQVELTDRADLDDCARIALSSAAGTTTVEVALPDGRYAARTVLRREDVIPTLQALLVVPTPVLEMPAPSSDVPLGSPPVPRPSAARASKPARALRLDGPEASSAQSTSRAFGAELSVLGGARFGDGRASYALGARSSLDIAGWLVGFEGRVDRYRELSENVATTALELGLLAGRRLRFSAVTLDLVGGPALAMPGGAMDVRAVAEGSTPPEPPPTIPDRGSGPVPRLLAGARFGFGPDSVLRTFLGFEGAFGPARASGVRSAEASSLPRWVLGLSVGATLGTR